MAECSVKVHVDTSELDALADRIKKVEILSVLPGDVIVLTVAWAASEAEVFHLLEAWSAVCDLPNKVIVLHGGVTVSVARPEPGPALR